VNNLNNLSLNSVLQNVIDDTIKRVAPYAFAEGANALADKISYDASNLLREGRPEGGRLMNEVKAARKLRKDLL